MELGSWTIGKYFSLFVFAVGASAAARAGVPAPQDASPREAAQTLKANREIFSRELPTADRALRPVPEIQHFAYLLINSDLSFEPKAKEVIARNLPPDVKLVVLTREGNQTATANQFGGWVGDRDRVIVATDASYGNGYWARDSFPIATYTNDQNAVNLVWAQYYRPFQGGPAVANAVRAHYTKEDYKFVGGDLMADDDGRCFVVDSTRRFGMPDAGYASYYGCRALTLLPHKAGIGDVDEVLKILPGKQALTQIADYIPTLQNLGYTVTLLPDPKGFRTYANSVILNGTAFVPSYGGALDEEAVTIYRKFGYRAVLVPSTAISDSGHGSLHCITMAYPEIPADELLHQLAR